nr:uncharacterized protein LOC129259132 [Lytechinus pictus]
MVKRKEVAKMESPNRASRFVTVLYVLCVAMETVSSKMFLQEPADSASFAGDAVTLKCQVNLVAFTNNTHQMIVAWKQDNVLLINSSSIPHSPALSSSVSSSSAESEDFFITGNPAFGEYDITFPSTSNMNSGNYTCGIYMSVMVQIPGGGVHIVPVFVGATRSALMKVLPDERPVCSLEPDLQNGGKPTIPSGTLTTFICSVTEVNYFHLNWRVRSATSTNLHENMMEDTQGKVGSGVKTLVYNRTVTPLDDGNVFECEMRSSAFPTLNRTCALPPLTILYKPNANIVPLANTSHIYAGDDISFYCSVDANPLTNEMEWVVTPPQNIAFHGHQIEVHQALSPQNFINITCQASNEIGMASTSIVVHLIPVYKPLVYISMVTSPQSSQPDEGVRFRCNIDASPSPVIIRWTVQPDNRVVIQKRGREMVLSSLSNESMYVDISCLVTNRIGSAMAHAFVYLPPEHSGKSLTNPQDPEGTTFSYPNENETISTTQYPVNSTNQFTTPETNLSTTQLPETNSTSPYSNITVFEPEVVEPGSLPYSPFEERLFIPFLPQATLESTPTEQTDRPTTTQYYPSISSNLSVPKTQAISHGMDPTHANILVRNKYIIVGGVTGGIFLVFTLVAMAICLSRIKVNRSLQAASTRVIYTPGDNSLALPFAQPRRQSSRNPYKSLSAAVQTCEQSTSGVERGYFRNASTKF